jgi:hypothetical protein
VVVGGRFCHRSLSAILRRKIGKPRKEIGNINGFEYMYIDLRVSYFQYFSSISIKIISMGKTLFPSMVRLALP